MANREAMAESRSVSRADAIMWGGSDAVMLGGSDAVMLGGSDAVMLGGADKSICQPRFM